MDAKTGQKTAKPIKKGFWSAVVPGYLNYIVLVLSLGLIAFISYDTYFDINFLTNQVYLKYQLYVCLFFLAEYFYRLILTRRKLKFLIFALPFLLISIPYVNLMYYFGIEVNYEMAYYIRFIPVIRGLVALVMVVTYAAQNLATTVFVSYTLILTQIVYMSGLVFYVAEKGINPAVKNFWYALWWAGMNVTTIGCYINPLTTAGMILGLILSLLGIVMFPLFTVYLGTILRVYSHKTGDSDDD